MDPITIGLLVAAGAQLVSGIMQYYNSEKAAGATKQRLKEIEAMFDAIVPPEFDLKVYDDPKLAADIPGPQLNIEALTPEMFQQVGQYVPEVAEFVQETNPQLVEATEAAKTGRRAQLDALERYRQIAGGEFDPELQQQLSEASQRANMEAQSRSDSILQDAQRRGQFGSGIMLASQQNAASEAMARQARESQMAAAEGYRNRMLALDKSANLGGDIRDSEMSEEARNVGILNSFNERTSRNYQDYLQQRADSLNRAKIMELERSRSVADANVQARNRSQEQARDLFNQQQQINYGVKKDNRQNSIDLIERQNRQKQQMYENLMQKARGKAGIAQTSVDYMNRAAQDQNQGIRNVGDAATAGGLYYGKYAGNQPKPAAPNPNAAYYGTGGDTYAGGMVQPGEDDRMAYPF